MKTVINTSTNPYYNLALEEYLLKEYDLKDDLFFVWRNEPCLVCGRNQNPFNEIHVQKAMESSIPIVRRITGGGTVFHDLGNINFSFITSKISKRLNNYKHFITPIIDILQRTGLDVRFVESSHIYLGDTKISGNAQTYYRTKMLHHGTLLFDSNQDIIQTVLKPKGYHKTSAIESTRAATTNIKQALGIDADITEFMNFILSEMLVEDIKSNTITLTPEDIKQIEELAQTKYQSWEWTIGETPEFWINKTVNGEIIQLHIKKGIIEESSLLPELLEGQSLDYERLLHLLHDQEEKDLILQLLYT